MKATLTFEDGRKFLVDVDPKEFQEKDEYFEFDKELSQGNDLHIGIYPIDHAPFFIGSGMAPDGFEYKCLVVKSRYEVVHLETNRGNEIIAFKKKRR